MKLIRWQIMSVALAMIIIQSSLAGEIPRPTPEQAAWQDMEMGMFFHFDIPIFTESGEGDWPNQGHLDPSLYNPTKLNTDQWLETAKAMGAKYTVFVAKHCTGFLSWQSDLYPYGVKQSKWREGKGDVVRDYVNSCRKFGIKPGLYCSVSANAHMNASAGLVNFGKGGDDKKQAEYVRICEKMLTELWSNYGPLTYVWFDGGALPPDKGGPDLVPIFKRLQPHAVAFGGPSDTPAGTTRWPGNEGGVTAYPNWSTVGKPGDYGDGGNPDGQVWSPPECDAPLRNQDWFWHPNSEQKIRSLEELVEMYYQSVGRNGNLILNGNIDRDGLVPAADLKRFKEFGDEIRRRFGKSIAETSGKGDVVELSLKKPTVINNLIIMEQITEGERIREYIVEGMIDGEWKEICKGQSVGHKRIERFSPVTVTKVRLRCVKSIAEPLIRKLAVYHVEPPKTPRADAH